MSGAGADAAATAAIFSATFEMTDDDTVALLLERYRESGPADRRAGHGAAVPRTISHPLPDAPWFEQGASWSARRVLVHVIAETAQHAGHADIIRETIDGRHETDRAVSLAGVRPASTSSR